MMLCSVFNLAVLVAQQRRDPSPSADGGGLFAGLFGICCCFGWVAVALAGIPGLALFGVFKKAGIPGWAAFVPVYNTMMLARVASKPDWWGLLMLVPILNFLIAFLLARDIAKAFGKDDTFALLLFFLGIVFYPILGYGDAVYTKPPPSDGSLSL